MGEHRNEGETKVEDKRRSARRGLGALAACGRAPTFLAEGKIGRGRVM
jgi:hypothetical protein